MESCPRPSMLLLLQSERPYIQAHTKQQSKLQLFTFQSSLERRREDEEL